MSANSFGNFGAFKLDFLKQIKNIPVDSSIDVTNVSHTVGKDVEYFQKNLVENHNHIGYTWEKCPEESPSMYKQLEVIYDKEDLTQKMHKNTLDLMATTKGHVHGFQHNQWENVSNEPPVLQKNKATRFGVHLSPMAQ